MEQDNPPSRVTYSVKEETGRLNVYGIMEESYVETATVRHFRRKGFTVKQQISIEDIKKWDLSPYLESLDVLAQKNDMEWRIACKGYTSQPGVDFNTALGQILKKMDSENAVYAVCMPHISKYKNQINKVPFAVRKKLNLHWLWVKENSEVEEDSPH